MSTEGKDRALGTPGEMNIEGSEAGCQTRGFDCNPSDANPMDIITEPHVIFTAKKGGVDYIRVHQTAEGFALYVKLKAFKEEQPVYTQRKELKHWVSLDRLVRHIRSNYGDEPPTLIVDLGSFSYDKFFASQPPPIQES